MYNLDSLRLYESEDLRTGLHDGLCLCITKEERIVPMLYQDDEEILKMIGFSDHGV